MSADRLREAARVLRERAEAATPGPWEHYPDGLVWCTDNAPGDPVCAAAEVDDAAYIATMHPGVGLALADWLDDEADRLADHVPVWELGIQRYPESWVGRTVESNVRHHYGRALALADLILGGAA